MPRHVNYNCNSGCSVELTLQIIGGKWKGVIVTLLLSRPHRFSEFERAMPGVTQRMLAKQLRDLEEAGIVRRDVISEKPVAVSYSLTELGRTLTDVVEQLRNWGIKYRHEARNELSEPGLSAARNRRGDHYPVAKMKSRPEIQFTPGEAPQVF